MGRQTSQLKGSLKGFQVPEIQDLEYPFDPLSISSSLPAKRAVATGERVLERIRNPRNGDGSVIGNGNGASSNGSSGGSNGNGTKRKRYEFQEGVQYWRSERSDFNQPEPPTATTGRSFLRPLTKKIKTHPAPPPGPAPTPAPANEPEETPTFELSEDSMAVIPHLWPVERVDGKKLTRNEHKNLAWKDFTKLWEKSVFRGTLTVVARRDLNQMQAFSNWESRGVLLSILLTLKKSLAEIDLGLLVRC